MEENNRKAAKNPERIAFFVFMQAGNLKTLIFIKNHRQQDSAAVLCP